MIKQIILEILDYLKFQVAEDRCTPEELRSMYDTITDNIAVDATIADIARHYGQSESNVRNVAARNYIGKPKRRVFYNFLKVAESILHFLVKLGVVTPLYLAPPFKQPSHTP